MIVAEHGKSRKLLRPQKRNLAVGSVPQEIRNVYQTGHAPTRVPSRTIFFVCFWLDFGWVMDSVGVKVPEMTAHNPGAVGYLRVPAGDFTAVCITT